MTKGEGVRYLRSKRGRESFFGKSNLVLRLIDEFNIPCKKQSAVSSLEKLRQKDKICIKFTKILKPLRKAINQCGYIGDWVLVEDNGSTYLTGPGGNVQILKDGEVRVSGDLSKYSGSQWKTIISKTIVSVIKEINKPIKEISFNASSSGFSDVQIQKHSKETSSYKVSLN